MSCVGDVYVCVLHQAGNTPLKLAQMYKRPNTAKVMKDAGGV